MKTFLKIIGVIVLIFIVLNMVWKDDLDKMENDTLKIVRIDNLIKEIESQYTLPYKDEVGGLMNITREEENLVMSYYLTDVLFIKNFQSMDNFKLQMEKVKNEPKKLINQNTLQFVQENNIVFIFRHYIKDNNESEQLINEIKISPNEW